MVHFCYDCTLYPPSLPHIECLQHGAKRSYVFKEGAIPEFDWQRYCESTVVVPVVDKAVDGDLIQALQQGFRSAWRQPADDGRCQLCEFSGGFRGYNNGSTDNNFSCICNNGNHSFNCHDAATTDGGGGVAIVQQPNYVAAGAMLLGGLVITATMFYLIKKKRIGSYEPV